MALFNVSRDTGRLAHLCPLQFASSHRLTDSGVRHSADPPARTHAQAMRGGAPLRRAQWPPGPPLWAVRVTLFGLGAFLCIHGTLMLKSAYVSPAPAVRLSAPSPRTRRALRSVSREYYDDEGSDRPCRVARGGPHFAADSRGFTCAQHKLDESKCCPRKGLRYSCYGCEQGCCAEYAVCVSCCLGPVQEGDRAALRAAAWAGRYGEALRNDAFALCIAACRSNSKSVLHENAYRAERHHCFGNRAPDVDRELYGGIFDFAEPTEKKRRKLRSLFSFM